jgi:hypothetical protein
MFWMYFHQHTSAAIIAIVRVVLLLQEYKGTDVVSCNSGCNMLVKKRLQFLPYGTSIGS